MKSKDFTPLIMWFCLLIGIILLAFIRSSRTTGLWNEYIVNFDIVFIISYILWMLIEVRISGPYRFTRHPAYAGMIVANAGISMYFFNWVTISVFLFILVPAILLRIAIEERTLFGIEGYSEFAQKRKRLFPGIW